MNYQFSKYHFSENQVTQIKNELENRLMNNTCLNIESIYIEAQYDWNSLMIEINCNENKKDSIQKILFIVTETMNILGYINYNKNLATSDYNWSAGIYKGGILITSLSPDLIALRIPPIINL